MKRHRCLSTIADSARPGWGMLVVATLLACLSPCRAAAQEPSSAARPLVAAVHVHSNWSTGTMSLDQLANRAERLGIDAIVLTDNFALQYEYGVPPLRGVVRKRMTVQSLSARQAGRYLNEVAAAQARHPRVLLVPGFEVNPHYYWTGSLLTRNLTMHNSQRNLLMLGLTKAEDYAALPLSGNPASFTYRWQTALNVSPALLLIPAVWLWRTSRSVSRRTGRPRRRRLGRSVSAAVLGATALILLLNAYPFSQPVFSSYTSDLGYRPYQAFIDAVHEKGGLTIWSLPETRDHNTYSFGPLGEVTVQTKPHPEALLQTAGYSGFGGLYQDTRFIAEPGGGWDQTLRQYLDGQRAPFPVLFGEIAFHFPGQAGIELDQVLDVMWVREWSAAGIVDAMRTGRLYAVGQYGRPVGMRLDEFRLHPAGGAHSTISGETLRVAEGTALRLDVSVSATDGQAHPVSVTIVRSGEAVAELKGETPFHHTHSDGAGAPGEPAYYRVIIRGEGEILSNPIFVVPHAEAGVS